MNDPFQVPAFAMMFRSRPEDLPRQDLSIHFSIGPQNPRSEPLDEPPPNLFIAKSPMPRLIRVQRQDPQVAGQGPRYGALSRGDPADEADHGNQGGAR